MQICDFFKPKSWPGEVCPLTCSWWEDGRAGTVIPPPGRSTVVWSGTVQLYSLTHRSRASHHVTTPAAAAAHMGAFQNSRSCTLHQQGGTATDTTTLQSYPASTMCVASLS